MKKWLKQQVTEFTAWIGFLLIVAAMLHVPYWMFITIGVILITINDDSAKAWAANMAPGVAKWIDNWKSY